MSYEGYENVDDELIYPVLCVGFQMTYLFTYYINASLIMIMLCIFNSGCVNVSILAFYGLTGLA